MGFAKFGIKNKMYENILKTLKNLNDPLKIADSFSLQELVDLKKESEKNKDEVSESLILQSIGVKVLREVEEKKAQTA